MFVCLCKGVSDRQLKQAVTDGANSWREVRIETECATQCGKCACMAKAIVDDALAQKFEDFDLAYAV
ncbi:MULTISPECIES: (2Fe-2S)-binding protein [Larsenimonas]|uniref:Bacterioferritin-associated ferredoxin n=1 Tax=Larsenimonas suaedae TaxID=1851019 RepID=A0ABU1GSU8_9GAMM|nr:MULTISPECIES: (2Fe-2S)-binding protein [Larsenimonas]MCM2972112.1 (2Fe-2S)-binding protein [Larsenimonas suaedae]MCM5704331.1 (2Fe-2S)-binding protein [Larsenimonas salina]MDR5895094.1 (2Fe-2S)-binding protein [Larsenimonas suaedae]